VAVILVFEGMTQEQYEESVRKVLGKERAESPSEWPVPGLLAHITGEGPNGFRVVDVWESQEAVDAFGAHLMPALQEIGVEGNPEMYEAHTYVSA
jgi:quinol monooxygenase YgiN